MEAEGKKLDIVDEKAWEKARFAGIAHECILKLRDPQMKKVFIETFQNGYRDPRASSPVLTYYEFYQLMTVTLGITGFEEWMYEDFETTIDNFGLAFMELNDVALWLRDHGFDLGVPITGERTDGEGKSIECDA